MPSSPPILPVQSGTVLPSGEPYQPPEMIPEQTSSSDELKTLLLDYIFPGKAEEELGLTEREILEWELNRWSESGFNLDEISHMLELRKELKPAVENLLYPVPLKIRASIITETLTCYKF